jgi:hypothetical protein
LKKFEEVSYFVFDPQTPTSPVLRTPSPDLYPPPAGGYFLLKEKGIGFLLVFERGIGLF